MRALQQDASLCQVKQTISQVARLPCQLQSKMLRIERLSNETSTVLRLSGRIQEEYLFQLQTEIERCVGAPKLDLKDVNLLDRPSVRFLIRCGSEGIELINCPLFIQEWMFREHRRLRLRTESQ